MVQSACQYDVMSASLTFKMASKVFILKYHSFKFMTIRVSSKNKEKEAKGKIVLTKETKQEKKEKKKTLQRNRKHRSRE